MAEGAVVGIWLNAGMLTGPYARYGTIVLGVLLVIYAIVGLSKFSFKVAPQGRKWIGGIVGVMTGVISAATGVQVIPSMPFMQAIGMEKDGLVQASACSSVATVALAFNLTSAGLLSASTALPGAVAMAAAFAGMFIGQTVRSRMDPEAFRRRFLIAMIFLGLSRGKLDLQCAGVVGRRDKIPSPADAGRTGRFAAGLTAGRALWATSRGSSTHPTHGVPGAKALNANGTSHSGSVCAGFRLFRRVVNW